MKADNQTILFPPLSGLLFLSGMVLVGLFLGNVLGMLYLKAQGIEDIMALMSNPQSYPHSRTALLVVQLMTALIGFIAVPLAFTRFIHWQKISSYNSYFPEKQLLVLLIAIVFTIAFMPFNALFIRLNEAMQLPESLKTLEEAMRAKEDELNKLTQFLINFESYPQALLGLIVIAVVPGIGEELLFRGTLQPIFVRLFRNQHVAIWVTAIVFSAIHFQFYGFLPRMLLGAAFGYLYWWSGNIYVPMLAHFTNNAFTVVMVWLYNQKMTQLNFEEAQDVPVWLSLVSGVVSVALLWYIFQLCRQRFLSFYEK